jgi:formylmethanofuran dehydrogenase subunit E
MIILASIISVTTLGDINIYLLPYGKTFRVVYRDDNIIRYDEVFDLKPDAVEQYLSFIKSGINPSHPDGERNRELLKKRLMVWGKEQPPPKSLPTHELDNFYDLK